MPHRGDTGTVGTSTRIGGVTCALVLAVVALAGPGSGLAGGSPALLARAHATAAYAAMQRYFYSQRDGTYGGRYPQKGHAQLWPYSQALAGTLAMSRIPGIGARYRPLVGTLLTGLAAYAAGGTQGVYAPIYGGTGDVFYDDNNWVGISLVDAADQLKNRAMLTQARAVLRLIETGWDRNKTDACPGGVYWLDSPRSRIRTAVSTANGALLSVLLFERTHEVDDLYWARQAFNWSRACLGTPDGLVADHIDPGGKVNSAIWSYNQGAMIATAVHLYRSTHDPAYLKAAELTATSALAAIADPLKGGEPASFLAIFFVDLLQLASVDHDQTYRNAVEAFADAAWSQERDPRTGLFHFGHTSATLLDQAAMVQVYAALTSP